MNHIRKPPSAHRPLAIMFLDVPDSSAGLGPIPLLHRLSSQHESHTTTPAAASGSVHLSVQSSCLPQPRLNIVTEFSFTIFLITQRFSFEVQLTISLLGDVMLQYSSALGSFSRTHLQHCREEAANRNRVIIMGYHLEKGVGNGGKERGVGGERSF